MMVQLYDGMIGYLLNHGCSELRDMDSNPSLGFSTAERVDIDRTKELSFDGSKEYPLKILTFHGDKLPINQHLHIFSGNIDIRHDRSLILDTSNNLYLCRESYIVTPIKSITAVHLNALNIRYSRECTGHLCIELEKNVRLIHEQVTSFCPILKERRDKVIAVTNEFHVLWVEIFQDNFIATNQIPHAVLQDNSSTTDTVLQDNSSTINQIPRTVFQDNSSTTNQIPRTVFQDNFTTTDITNQIPYTIRSTSLDHDSCMLLTLDNQVLIIHSDLSEDVPKYLTSPHRFEIELINMKLSVIRLPLEGIQQIYQYHFVLTTDGQLFQHDLRCDSRDMTLKLDSPILIQDFRLSHVKQLSYYPESSTEYELVVKDKSGNFHHMDWCDKFQDFNSRVLNIPSKYEFKPRARRLTKRAW